MQIPIKSIRGLGFKRVLQETSVGVIDKIRYQNTRYYTEGVKAWSILPKVNKDNCYDGMKAVLRALNIDENTEIDSRKKREFKNYWNSIWVTFGTATNLDEFTVSAISSFGLKLQLLLFEDDNYKQDDGIIDFYDKILMWAVLSNQERTLCSIEGGIDSVLDSLVLDEDRLFLYKLRRCLNV